MLKHAIASLMILCGVASAQDGWTAKWIAAPWSTIRDGAEVDGSKPMPIFRRTFEINGKVQHAELRIAGLGQFELSLDGRPVGPRGLHQDWTNFSKTVTYQTYDVTSAANPGTHAIGVMLGNGMYNVQRSLMANGKPRYIKFEGTFGVPRLIAELRMTYVDGKSEVIASDGSWKVTRGPVVFSSIYGGEDYDARKDLAGWDGVAFNDAAWDGAKIVDGGGARLIPALAPEVVESAEHKPVKVAQVGPDKTVYDLGQNFAGVVSIRARGAVGATLKLTPGELLRPDGSVSQGNTGGPMWWSYTLAGSSGAEVWEPKFDYYGFRYVQAEWSTDRPAGKLEELAGHEWHSASKITGSFENSNATLNAIHKLIVEAMHNNEVSIFTDCPHREKLGWDEETHLVAPGLIFNNDLRGLYAATGLNFADAQHADGNMPTIVPQYTVFGGKSSVYDDSPEWGSAAILAPWAAYRFYGDRAQLERDYPVMQRYLAYLKTRAVDGIVAYGLGDWYDIGPGNPGFSKLTTLGVTGTLMLYQDAVVMQKIAALLGKPADAVGYGHIAEDEKKAFNARFWDSTNGYYDKGSQTAQAVPLALGLVPDDAKARLLDYLVADIHAHQDHITTGEVGFPYLLRTLMENGRNDVLLAVLLRKDPPSYASQLAAGATALTEAWDANPRSSQDHFMLGGAEEWFYRGLGGIDFDQSRGDPATRITIHPQMVAGIDWVRCGYDSVLGHIQSDWRKSATGGALDITIPPNSQATVILPDGPQVVGPGRHHFTLKPTP